MEIFIHSVLSDSAAARSGLVAGDQLLAINGREDLEDMFDYQFEVSDTDYLECYVRHTDGTEEIIALEKDLDEDPGLIFTSPVFTPIKTCNNACPFCFIDQQPPGLRSTLYVKDDDWRLSYFTNTYITLTNLTERDRQRIEMIRPGPLYVSVHSTVPKVRVQLLQNPRFAGKIMDELRWLAELGIPFHCQVVICPGINEGDSLSQTLNDLYSLHPEAMSVAVIPVGLTQHRDHLPPLSPVEAATAKEVINRVRAFTTATGADDFVFLSDEFYYKAGLPLPKYDDYAGFPQLDDGVGTARLLLEDFYQLEPYLPEHCAPSRKVLILTGKLAAMTLDPIIRRLNEIRGLYLDCLTVESRFWGQSVDVAGLITGQDLLETLSRQDLSGYDFALIPSVMLKQDTDLFLDGITVSELRKQSGIDIRVVDDPYSAKQLMGIIDLGLSVPPLK